MEEKKLNNKYPELEGTLAQFLIEEAKDNELYIFYKIINYVKNYNAYIYSGSTITDSKRFYFQSLDNQLLQKKFVKAEPTEVTLSNDTKVKATAIYLKD